MKGEAMQENGTPPVEDPVVTDLRKRVESFAGEREHLKARLDEINDQVARYERAIRALTGERAQGRPRGPRPSREAGADRTHGPQGGKGISDEALERVKEDILRYAEDHEEFRQVDIRTMVDAAVSDSGKLSTAFKVLRQEDQNFLRLARKDGNNMWFRLTRAAVQEHFSGADR